jgi:hypothetical protein
LKTVPLVMYKDGQRTVIGEAEVEDDGNDLVVRGTIHPEFASLLDNRLEEESSVSARHAKEYGVPLATSFSIGAWAKEVERYSFPDEIG